MPDYLTLQQVTDRYLQSHTEVDTPAVIQKWLNQVQLQDQSAYKKTHFLNACYVDDSHCSNIWATSTEYKKNLSNENEIGCESYNLDYGALQKTITNQFATFKDASSIKTMYADFQNLPPDHLDVVKLTLKHEKGAQMNVRHINAEKDVELKEVKTTQTVVSSVWYALGAIPLGLAIYNFVKLFNGSDGYQKDYMRAMFQGAITEADINKHMAGLIEANNDMPANRRKSIGLLKKEALELAKKNARPEQLAARTTAHQGLERVQNAGKGVKTALRGFYGMLLLIAAAGIFYFAPKKTKIKNEAKLQSATVVWETNLLYNLKGKTMYYTNN